MPAFHGHDDDFLFQIQYPPADKEPKESRKAADELLERFLQRFRRTCGPPFVRPLSPPPQQGVTDTDISPMVIRAFPVSIERTSGNFPVMLNGLVFRSNSLKT